MRSGRDREGIARPTAAVLDDPSAGLDGEARTACARLVRWMAEDCLLGRSGEGGPSLEQLFVFTHDADFHRLASAPLAHAPGVALFRVEKRRNASSIVPQTGAGLPAQAEQNGLPRP